MPRGWGRSTGCWASRWASSRKGSTLAARRRAYAADVTYATAKEAGFDYLRDGLALESRRTSSTAPFHFAIVDEADSILIDEARIPLVIAGESGGTAARASSGSPRSCACCTPGVDFDTDEYGHNIALTEAGNRAGRGPARLRGALLLGEPDPPRPRAQRAPRRSTSCGATSTTSSATGKVELVDEFTGRVADRAPLARRPARRARGQGGRAAAARGPDPRLDHPAALPAAYPRLAGMTATAEPAAEELLTSTACGWRSFPPIAPTSASITPDVVFTHKAAKRRGAGRGDRARARDGPAGPRRDGERRGVGGAGGAPARARASRGEVLNAKNDEREAQVVAAAGAPGAVTISTNMAGRGTDIRLGAARRARARAGGRARAASTSSARTATRAGASTGSCAAARAGRGIRASSRFFVSLEDDLVRRYGVEKLVTARHLPPPQDGAIDKPAGGRRDRPRPANRRRARAVEVRRTLYAYSAPVERQRRAIMERRLGILTDAEPQDALVLAWPRSSESSSRVERKGAMHGRAARRAADPRPLLERASGRGA